MRHWAAPKRVSPAASRLADPRERIVRALTSLAADGVLAHAHARKYLFMDIYVLCEVDEQVRARPAAPQRHESSVMGASRERSQMRCLRMLCLRVLLNFEHPPPCRAQSAQNGPDRLNIYLRRGHLRGAGVCSWPWFKFGVNRDASRLDPRTRKLFGACTTRGGQSSVHPTIPGVGLHARRSETD